MSRDRILVYDVHVFETLASESAADETGRKKMLCVRTESLKELSGVSTAMPFDESNIPETHAGAPGRKNGKQPSKPQSKQRQSRQPSKQSSSKQSSSEQSSSKKPRRAKKPREPQQWSEGSENEQCGSLQAQASRAQPARKGKGRANAIESDDDASSLVLSDSSEESSKINDISEASITGDESDRSKPGGNNSDGTPSDDEDDLDDDVPAPVPNGWEASEHCQPFEQFLMWTSIDGKDEAWHRFHVVKHLADHSKGYTHDAHLHGRRGVRGVALSEEAFLEGCWLPIKKISKPSKYRR